MKRVLFFGFAALLSVWSDSRLDLPHPRVPPRLGSLVFVK
jgi:hypothetical protein